MDNLIEELENTAISLHSDGKDKSKLYEKFLSLYKRAGKELSEKYQNDFFVSLLNYPAFIYDDENFNFAVEKLKSAESTMESEEEKENFFFEIVNNHLFYKINAEAREKRLKNFEDTNWYKFAAICEEKAQELGWDGKYKDFQENKEKCKNSDLMVTSESFKDAIDEMTLQQLYYIAFNTIVPNIKFILEINPQINCKNALYALYAEFSDKKDAELFKKYSAMYSDISIAIEEALKDFEENDSYSMIECCLLSILLSHVSCFEEKKIDYVYGCNMLFKCLKIESEGYDELINVGLAFSALCLYFNFNYWYSKAFLGPAIAPALISFNKNKICEDESVKNKAEIQNAENKDEIISDRRKDSCSFKANSKKKGDFLVLTPLLLMLMSCFIFKFNILIGAILLLIFSFLLILSISVGIPKLMQDKEKITVKLSKEEIRNIIEKTFSENFWKQGDDNCSLNFFKYENGPVICADIEENSECKSQNEVSIYVSKINRKAFIFPTGFSAVMKIEKQVINDIFCAQENKN